MRFLALRRVSFAPSDDPGTQNVRIVDQYGVSTDARSGIVNDPNREDDPHYILRLIGQVITVSLETQRIIASLPSLNLGA
jgi:hypothetical protein